MKKSWVAGLVGGLMMGGACAAVAAGFLTNGLPVAGGTQYPTTLPLTGLEQAPFDTQLPQGANPASEAITVQMLQQGTFTTASNATSFTAAAAAVTGGSKITFTLTGAPTGAQTVTTPTAALMIAALPVPQQVVGYSYVLKFVNQGGTSSGVWTIAGGSNVTVTGNATAAVGGSRSYLVTLTSLTAISMADIGN